MLTVTIDGGWRDCTGIARRDFLRIGALSLGSLGLADLLSLLRRGRERVRDSSATSRLCFFICPAAPAISRRSTPR